MKLRSRLEDFCRVHTLDALFVFGSRAEEVCRSLDADLLVPAASSSDVDVGILPPESAVLPVERKVAIATGLEDLLGVSRSTWSCFPKPTRSSPSMSFAASACSSGTHTGSTSTSCSCCAGPATSPPSSASGWR